MKTFFCYLLQFTWGIVQNLFGLLGFLFTGLFGCRYLGRHKTAFVRHVPNNFGGSMSLGVFLFVSDNDVELIKHEYGHTVQSLLLGPLWLLVIGIPSFVWATCFEGYRRRKNISYYSFYTERWANAWGGVTVDLPY